VRTYAQLSASASQSAPFSNSTEGEMWTSKWCDRCAHDRPAREGNAGEGCNLLLIGLTGRTPAEWLPRDKAQLGDAYWCTEFKKDRKAPPAPPEQIPGQLSLFHEGKTP
jgi:hypothetical protein